MSKARKKKRKSSKPGSSLSQHRRTGKLLVPPLRQLPQLEWTSWINDRLPELVWLALLANGIPREEFIELMRAVADRTPQHVPGTQAPVRHLYLTDLARDMSASRGSYLDLICGPARARDLLAPLLLFPDLPAGDSWRAILQREPDDSGWESLASAVAKILNHQSEMATDIRWSVVACAATSGRLQLSPDTAHLAKEVMLYPYLGDERAVRPIVRAMEGAFALMNLAADKPPWPALFWDHCMRSTSCFPLPRRDPVAAPVPATTMAQLGAVREAIIHHCHSTRRTTAVDARHDAVFGTALYSLAVLSELMRIGCESTVSARFALRTLLELYVTLAYLLVRDKPDLWQSFRVFGSGQAKLANLKLGDANDQPLSIRAPDLELVAGEDMWEEFLNIDLGHWSGANLRALSIDAGVKDDYDTFYPWTSMYVHGHWGALRITVLDTCGNPLHRLHRIPRHAAYPQPDIVPDAVRLTDKILALLDKAYAPFTAKLLV